MIIRTVIVPEDAHLEDEFNMRAEFESEHESFGEYDEDLSPEIYADNGFDF